MVSFDCSKACKRPVEVHTKRVRGLQKFGESALTGAKDL